MGNFDKTYRLDKQEKPLNCSYSEENDNIDIDRLVWDVEYRELVKRILEPKGGSSISMVI
ncbi:hypothetical protein [Kiloniella antarctica]|uniref:Uncharacterized protein n=1 Tax=Kiloniella antarctica TaxID=1550907 RepID=A0ABW5BRU1_9PROT